MKKLGPGRGVAFALLLAVAGGCSRRELPRLHRAARRGDVAEIAALVKAGAPIDEPGGGNGWTPLQHAIRWQQTRQELRAAAPAVESTSRCAPRRRQRRPIGR